MFSLMQISDHISLINARHNNDALNLSKCLLIFFKLHILQSLAQNIVLTTYTKAILYILYVSLGFEYEILLFKLKVCETC